MNNNLKAKERIYGQKACNIAGQINKYYFNLGVKAKYKTVAIKTDKGIYNAYTNFIKGCPIFLPLKDNKPYILDRLNQDGFFENVDAPSNLDEIMKGDCND